MAADHYPHIRVTGSPLERGEQYGRSAAARVRRSIEAYATVFERWAALDWPSVRRRAMAYVPFIEAHEPRYMEEIHGIARGAGVDVADVLAINVRTEVMFLAKARAAEGAEAKETPDGCTAMAVVGGAATDGHSLAAQNWDWLVHARETLVVLEVEQDEGPRFVSLVEAGLLAKFGMNSSGVAVLTNAMVSDADRGEAALPYHVVLRSLHDASSISDALARLQQSSRASSANYLIVQRDGLAVDVEAPPGDFSELLLLEPADGVLVHTNHFLSPRFRGKDVGLWVMPDSPFRLQAARRALENGGQSLGIRDVQRGLCDHANHPTGVCTHVREEAELPEQEATVTSAVMDLQARRMWVADGNPCSTGYRELDYSDFLGP